MPERFPYPSRSDVLDKAACRTADTTMFTSKSPDDVERAKTVCVPCPARDACLSYALATNQTRGVWGGRSEGERLAMLEITQPLPRPKGRP